MIDTTGIHPSFKKCSFKYAACTNIDFNAEETVIHHRILVKGKGKREKWRYLGADNGALDFKDESEAHETVATLKKWADA